MFYFGGMTLGYLMPPAKKPGMKSGENVADQRHGEVVLHDCLPKPDGRSLVARANWFGLYW